MTEENQLTEDEVKASENGWKPKSEWEGADDDWVPAKEFNRRGEMIGNLIKEQKQTKKLQKQIEDLKTSVRALGDHNKKVYEKAKSDALDELKELKKEALKDGDVDTVVDIDDKILDIKSSTQEDVTANLEDEVPKEMEDWLDNNDWYNTNGIMKNAFDGIVISLVNEEPELAKDPSTALKKATDMLKQEFPEKFNTSPRKTKGNVEDTKTTKKSEKGNNKYKASMLSPEQRKIAESFAGSGITLDEYAQQLGELGELG